VLLQAESHPNQLQIKNVFLDEEGMAAKAKKQVSVH
jgi:hypothetical protein